LDSHPGFLEFFQEIAPMRKMVLTLAGLALIASPAFAGKFNKVVSVGDKAPTFSGIPAVLGTQDTSLSLSDIKEDVVVLVFLANHCPVVVAYDDRIVDFANDYKGKSVKLVGVCVEPNFEGDKLPGIKEKVKVQGAPYVYGYDESQAIGKAYGATNTPQFVVLDKNRVIRYLGALDDNQNESKVTKHYVRDAVDAVLKGEKPEIEETQPKGCGISYTKRSK